MGKAGLVYVPFDSPSNRGRRSSSAGSVSGMVSSLSDVSRAAAPLQKQDYQRQNQQQPLPADHGEVASYTHQSRAMGGNELAPNVGHSDAIVYLASVAAAMGEDFPLPFADHIDKGFAGSDTYGGAGAVAGGLRYADQTGVSGACPIDDGSAALGVRPLRSSREMTMTPKPEDTEGYQGTDPLSPHVHPPTKMRLLTPGSAARIALNVGSVDEAYRRVDETLRQTRSTGGIPLHSYSLNLIIS
jgi:hypothetical protein